MRCVQEGEYFIGLTWHVVKNVKYDMTDMKRGLESKNMIWITQRVVKKVEFDMADMRFGQESRIWYSLHDVRKNISATLKRIQNWFGILIPEFLNPEFGTGFRI
jgi:hypothetical protein